MSVLYSDFFIQAQKLASSGEEIDSRSAMSRSYYAAYHAALENAKRLGLPEAGRRDKGSHEQLISRFEGQGKALKKLAMRLRARKMIRAVADYQIHEKVTSMDGSLQIR